MNGQLTLKFEWPGLARADLIRVTGGNGVVKEVDSSLQWILPLDGWGGEQVAEVRSSLFPLQGPLDSINVRSIEDLRYLGSIPPSGGFGSLLRAADAIEVVDSITSRLSRFRDRLTNEKRAYIFAAHRNAAKCLRYCRSLGVEVVAFIDNDVAKQGSEYLGRQVLPLHAIPIDSVIINASGRYCVEIGEQLRRDGYSWAIDLMELLLLYDLPFQAESHFRRYVVDTVENRLRLLTLYLMLADDQSREVLDSLVYFRMTLDSAIPAKVASPYSQEFFAPDLLRFGLNEVFVDGGAFDGDSYLRFAAMAPGFSKAYLFEPDTEICRRAALRLVDDRRISICNYGLWSSTAELRFSSTGGMDGAICEDGDIRIAVVAVDEFVRDRVTHIKLDVEGAEQEALLGARQQIGGNRPKMAVALYHRADDLWKLPTLIEALGGAYRFGIRHYSQTMDDTIVYAEPII